MELKIKTQKRTEIDYDIFLNDEKIGFITFESNLNDWVILFFDTFPAIPYSVMNQINSIIYSTFPPGMRFWLNKEEKRCADNNCPECRFCKRYIDKPNYASGWNITDENIRERYEGIKVVDSLYPEKRKTYNNKVCPFRLSPIADEICG